MQIKTAPYEILLRFNCEPGERLGVLRGCHRIMETYAVDDDGLIVGRIAGASAADFPADKIAAYLGEQFADFNAQLEAERAATAEAKAEAETLRASLGEAEYNLKVRSETITDMQTQIAMMQRARYDGPVS